MTDPIQPLESRVFLSATTVTAATFAADKAAILAYSTAIKAQSKALLSEAKVQSSVVAAAFKRLPKADQAFLKTLNLDSKTGTTSLSKDVTALLNASSALASKSAAVGVSLLKKASPANLLAAQKDIAALNTVTQVPLTNLQALFSSTKIQQDRDLIVAAFPQETQLVDAIIAEETNTASGQASILSQAIQYQAATSTLATDLATVRDAVGTFPNLVGTLSGTATAKTGQLAPITLVFTTEDTVTGKVTGTVTDQTTGGVETFKGNVTFNGALKLVVSGSSKRTISGQAAGASITGKFAIGKIAGTFAVTQIAV